MIFKDELQEIPLKSNTNTMQQAIGQHLSERGGKSQDNSSYCWKVSWLESFSMFVFIYATTCSKESTGIDLQFVVGLMIAIPICVRQTGANLNPSVSLTMTYKSNESILTYSPLLWTYIKAQIVGACLAMIVAVFLNHVYRGPAVSNLNTFQQIGTSQIIRIIFSEVFGTFILAFMFLYSTGPQSFVQNKGAQLLYIAIFVYIGRKFAPISSNQINAALTISQALIGIFKCDFTGFKFLSLWIIGNILGVLLAANFYTRIFAPTLEYLQLQQTKKVTYELFKHHNSQQKEAQLRRSSGSDKMVQIRKSFNDYYKKLQHF